MKPRQTVTHVPIGRLTAHPSNIRDDLGDLTEMARSVAEHGILQPLTVTEDLEHEGKLLLLAGHRRLGAACLAKLDVVPVIIRHGLHAEDEQMVVMLVENTQRRDLNPVERAEAYAALRNRGLIITEIARRTGSSIASISYYLRLLDLPDDELEEVRAGERPVSQALAQVRAERQEERLRLAGRPVGRPKGRATTPYFSDSHPLAKVVRARCNHRGVPKVGSVGCGACWEQVIRNDVAGAEPSRAEPSRARPLKPYDEAVVHRDHQGRPLRRAA
jgi:ParB family chromosome partitioning protein